MTGAGRITTERLRQVESEGWTPDHDAAHTAGELKDAARCYLIAAQWPAEQGPMPAWVRDQAAAWPWDESWWKPSTDPVRNLEKAGALIAAEIDRLQPPGLDEIGDAGAHGSVTTEAGP